MNIKVYIFVLLSLLFLALSEGKLFHRGRPLKSKYGMLGIPRVEKLEEIEALIKPQWIDQRLDHFNPADTRTWKQRYFINDTFYKPGGPVFLQLGGEGVASPVWLVEGYPAKLAQYFGALAILLEHRYYGESHPTPDMSSENLAYLTSEQALSDAAHFRNNLTETLGLKDSRWIVFGGSYSGSLAAWFRLKYPHLVSGAVATSAPVYALVDFQDYLAVVRDSLATTGPQCNEAIQRGINQVAQLLDHPVGWRLIEKSFKLCDPFNATFKEDVENLFSSIANNFEGIVQYNKDNREFEGAKDANVTIDTLCGLMIDNNVGSELERLSAVNSLMLSVYEQKCLDYKYENFLKGLQSIDWNSSASAGGRQWTYQTCVEFGFFQSSDLKDQPFGNYFPVGFFIDQCKDIFGEKFNRQVLEDGIFRTNTVYGGFGLKVTNVAFPNGSIDPWHKLGILKDLSPEAVAIYINGTAHCADMYPESADDLPELKAAREQIKKLITIWLEE